MTDAAARDAIENLPLVWGEPVQGLQMGVAVPDWPVTFRVERRQSEKHGPTDVVLREPFPVRLAIRNSGKVARTIFWHHAFYSPLRIEVSRPGQEEIHHHVSKEPSLRRRVVELQCVESSTSPGCTTAS